jgi:hypothetical protein
MALKYECCSLILHYIIGRHFNTLRAESVNLRGTGYNLINIVIKRYPIILLDSMAQGQLKDLLLGGLISDKISF